MAKHNIPPQAAIPSYTLENFRPIHREEVAGTGFGYNHMNPAQRISGFELYSSEGMKGNLGPLRSEFYRVSLILSGTHFIQLGLEAFQAKPGMFFCTVPHQVFAKSQVSADTFGYYRLFTTDFLEALISPGRLAGEFPFFDYTGAPLFQLSSAELSQIESFLFKINDELQLNKPGKEVAIRMYLYLMLLEAKRSYQQQGLHLTREPLESAALVSRYKRLVSQHFLTKRHVADYASLLYVTPNHLNRVVKGQTGQTASQLITQMLLQESRVLLKHTDLTVSQLSYQLQFSDPASFNRFFKKNAGLTPLEFRAQA